MKRVLLIASIIGLFMATTMDLQARYRRNDLPRRVRSGISFGLTMRAPLLDRYNSYGQYDRHVRSGISFGLSIHAPLLDRYNSYGQYNNRPGRHVAREIRRNEERIWKLEKRIDRLYRYGGNYREIRELEQEINWLERRNNDLCNRRY